MPDPEEFADRIAAAYASDGPALVLGRGVLDGATLPEDLTQLGTGEAMVTILSERGAPTPVVWTKMIPPTSLMAAIDEKEVESLARDSSLWSTYAEDVDRESARERLTAKTAAGAAGTGPDAASPKPRPQPKGKKSDDNAVISYIKSREGRTMLNTVARGVFGLLKKRR